MRPMPRRWPRAARVGVAGAAPSGAPRGAGGVKAVTAGMVAGGVAVHRRNAVLICRASARGRSRWRRSRRAPARSGHPGKRHARVPIGSTSSDVRGLGNSLPGASGRRSRWPHRRGRKAPSMPKGCSASSPAAPLRGARRQRRCRRSPLQRPSSASLVTQSRERRPVQASVTTSRHSCDAPRASLRAPEGAVTRSPASAIVAPAGSTRGSGNNGRIGGA